MCGKLEGHEPTGDDERHTHPSLPSLLGGPGGLASGRPPVEEMSEQEMDEYAEWWFNRSLAHFEAVLAAAPKAPKRRMFHDYTAKNCEEAWRGP